jgi:hypothetical protein
LLDEADVEPHVIAYSDGVADRLRAQPVIWHGPAAVIAADPNNPAIGSKPDAMPKPEEIDHGSGSVGFDRDV